jgi:hypothetical protein
MSEFTWRPEAAEDGHSERQPEQAAAHPATLALSLDEFSALEERILRAVNLVKRERLARAAADDRARLAEARVTEQVQSTENQKREFENLQKEVDALRAERDQVRQRVERLLSQLDALEA